MIRWCKLVRLRLWRHEVDASTIHTMKRIALTAAVLLLSGCAVSSAEAEVVPRSTHAAVLEVSFSVAGDSITATHDRITGEPRGELSWVNWAVTPKVEFVGGYAASGMMGSEIDQNMVAPFDGDVLVVMAGTNDVMKYVPTATTLAHIDSIITRSEIPNVLVSAIAPTDRDPAAALAFNVELAAHAGARGWTFTDPWTTFRAADGTWVPGAAYDPFHPTGATQAVVGATLREYIVASYTQDAAS